MRNHLGPAKGNHHLNDSSIYCDRHRHDVHQGRSRLEPSVLHKRSMAYCLSKAVFETIAPGIMMLVLAHLHKLTYTGPFFNDLINEGIWDEMGGCELACDLELDYLPSEAQ